MATFTAHALVGQSHPNHAGILPTHRLYLSENSRPAWILLPEALSVRDGSAMESKVIWLSTLENMLEDGLLLIAVQALQDPVVTELAAEHFQTAAGSSIDLNRRSSNSCTRGAGPQRTSTNWC